MFESRQTHDMLPVMTLHRLCYKYNLISFYRCTNLVSVVGLDNEGVHMGVDVIITSDVLVDQQVFTLVAKYNMNLLGARTADIGT